MREEDVIFISSPCLPHPSPPSSSDLSDFPSFPVINYNSSHDSASTVTNSDFSSVPPLISSSMAPQDCSSSSEPASSSLASLNCSTQTEYFPSAYCQNSSVRSQEACSPLPPEDHSSIHDYTPSTLIPTYSSKFQMEYSPSPLLNGASTFLTSTHSLTSANNSSTSQPASSPSSKSPVNCSCQPEYLSTSCQNSMSISQTTYSYRSFQNCKSISEQTQSDCSSLPQMNGAFTSRTDDHSLSHVDYSSAYIIFPNKDPRDFSPVSSSSTLNYKPVNQHAKTTQECQVKAQSDECSLVSSIFPVDIPCICTYELPNDFSSGISSPHLNEHECSNTLQSQNYFDLSSNMASINGTTTPHVNATTHPCSKCTSTDHHHNQNTDFDPLTPWSTQSFYSPKIAETDVVSTNDELSVGHSLVNGSYLPSKSPHSFSIPNSVDPFSSFDTSPVQDSTCPNSADDTVFTSTHEKHPIMFPSCLHASPYTVIPKHTPFSEEENQVQECEVWEASLENKVRMDQDRQLCERFLDSLSRFEDWLQIAQITTSQGNRYKTLHQEAKLALRKYEVLLTEMREKLLDLESLNRQYWRLTQTPQQTLLPSVLRSRMQEVNTLWNSLQGETETLHRTFKSRVQQREQFETDQDDMKLCLTEMDLELSNVEYIYGGNSAEKIQQLKAFQEDVWSNMKKVEGLLERGDQLIDNSDPRDAADLEVEMTELGSYCQQIYIRLSRLQKRLVSTKLVFEDDFLDSAIEHLSSGSSDVFLDLDIEDRETSSPVNVPVTSTALPVDLEWDPLGDVGRSSSHDGQESFYTATSAPWKRLQRSDGSQSSLSSCSGITYSNMTRHEGNETLGDIYTNRSSPSNTCHLEWDQEQIHGRGLVGSALVQHSSPLETGKEQDITRSSVSLAIDEPDAEHKHNIHFALTRYYGKAADPDEEIDNQSQPNRSGQRRRQRRKKRRVRNQDTKGNGKPDVSILMENGDDLHKSSYRPPCSPCLWMRRLAFASVLLLVLVTSLLIPWGPQTCPSRRFSWSVMLTYVNGPPPT
ncbi:serine-rich adhesin for platelets-like [Dendropsophus ebraccatus]|uniref:serine-rich adhesin for platelets-like n=1 Tax=Dendropsophus ebraccatus TaxID=150705 RepID=UPI003831A5F4